MKIGWIADDPGYTGGAEMTQAEFRAAVPKGTKIRYCPPGEIVPRDRYVANNVVHYSLEDLEQLDAPVTWFHHDLSHWIRPEVKGWLDANASHIFCSPLHREKYDPYDNTSPLVPPMVDKRFKPKKANGFRKGTCSVAQWRAPSKGFQLVEEWAEENGEVDVYGPGVFVPQGPNVTLKGEMDPNKMPQLFWSYERFVFLPTAPEPFGRAVAEAFTAGLEVITNQLVGAVWWLQEAPERLRTASHDFWEICLA